VAPEPGPHLLGGGDHQGAQLPLRGGDRVHGAAPCGQQRGQRGPLRPGLGRGQPNPGQGVAGGAFSVDHIGLGPAATGRSNRAVQLHDHFPGVGEVAGQSGAVAASTLDRPGPQPTVALGQLQQLGVAIGISCDRDRGQQRAGIDRDQRGGVSIGVGVDPDDELDQFCQHGHCVLLTVADAGSGPVRSWARL
jgi:hypothetical protein